MPSAPPLSTGALIASVLVVQLVAWHRIGAALLPAIVLGLCRG